MEQKTLFLRFWEHEASATRKVISRIPQENLIIDLTRNPAPHARSPG
ncbi:MAG: hypothetical protein H0T92_24040 [Pyrinomonadaceae bacterium]|nr:hypothetical protein [Pyrinomonadaceae bacterium]